MQTKTNNISIKRILYLIACFVLLLFGSIFLCYQNKLLFDGYLCTIIITITFYLMYVLSLMQQRIDNRFLDSSTSYFTLFIRLLLACIIVVVAYFVPVFFAPVILLPFVLNSSMNELTSVVLSSYLTIILCFTCGYSNYVLFCYLILVLAGVMLSAFLKAQRCFYNISVFLIIITLNILIPVIFYYLSYLEVNSKIFVWGIILGFLCSFAIVFGYPLLLKEHIREIEDKYETLMSEEYPLMKDYLRYSKTQYDHAHKVSKICAYCAREIGANEKVAACGGLYYRIGKMEGEPEITNAIKLAENHCFPEDVITIMREFGGIETIDTQESAIVHMVDSLVTKIELLDSQTMSSTWNQNMVIYQTLNELSEKGLYDSSGLSMNQFLKIRECLVRLDSLI